MFRKASLGLFLAAVAALSLFLANASPTNSHRAEAASAPVQHATLAASPDGNCVQVSNTLCPNLGFLPAPVAPVPANALTFAAFPNAGTCGSFMDLTLKVTVAGGQPVADGTTIGLVTTLGSVSKTVTTENGSAVARLVI